MKKDEKLLYKKKYLKKDEAFDVTKGGVKYRKLYCDIPGLEHLPKQPKIETDINAFIDKDRWENSMLWNIGVSSRRKKEFKSKM